MCEEKDFIIEGTLKEGLKVKKQPSLIRRKKLRRTVIKKTVPHLTALKRRTYNKKYWRRKKNIINRRRKLLSI